jgi:hypothetical protein
VIFKKGQNHCTLIKRPFWKFAN